MKLQPGVHRAVQEHEIEDRYAGRTPIEETSTAPGEKPTRRFKTVSQDLHSLKGLCARSPSAAILSA